jgi:hypothetical protein
MLSVSGLVGLDVGIVPAVDKVVAFLRNLGMHIVQSPGIAVECLDWYFQVITDS